MKAWLLAPLKLYFLLSLVSVICFSLDQLGLLKLPVSLIQNITVPIQYGLFQTGRLTSFQFGFIFQARFAAKENQALKNQLALVLSENASLRTKLAQSEAQVEQQDSLSPKTFNLTPARPIGLGRYLTLDKGSDNGVKVGEVVVYKDNYIGLIRGVTPQTAQVQLELDPDSKIAVFSQSQQGKAKGILQGQFGSEALMDKILHVEQITKGDLVYSEGTEGNLPRGLIMGSVTSVLERENELFKRAKVKPVFDARDLELAFIIKNQ